MTFRNWPFEAIAATSYLIANGTLTFQSLIEGHPLIPSWENIQTLDPSSWQSIAGLLWVIVAINTYNIKRYPHGAIIFSAVLNLIATTCLLMSGYTQEAFFAHALGLMSIYIANILMLQGNRINSKKTIFGLYPVACAATLFMFSAPPIMYNAFVSQDSTLLFVSIFWFTGHIFFALTDRNFQKKIFN